MKPMAVNRKTKCRKKRRNKCRLQLEEGKPPSDEGGGCPEGRRKERKNQIILSPSLLLRKIQPPRQRGPWCGASRRGFGTGDPSPTKRTTISHSSICGNDRSPTSVPAVGAIHESPACCTAMPYTPMITSVTFVGTGIPDGPHKF